MYFADFTKIDSIISYTIYTFNKNLKKAFRQKKMIKMAIKIIYALSVVIKLLVINMKYEVLYGKNIKINL